MFIRLVLVAIFPMLLQASVPMSSLSVEVFKGASLEEPLAMDCKGKVMTDLWPGHAANAGAGCFSRGSCDHDKWIRKETPRPAGPAGPVNTIVALTFPQWGSFYHFATDTLSRMYWIHKEHPDLVNDPSVYWHVGTVGKAGQEWAKLYGIKTSADNNRLLDGWWKAHTIYVPPALPGTFCTRWSGGAEAEADQKSMRKHILGWMRDTVGGNMGFDPRKNEDDDLDDVATNVLMVRRHPDAVSDGRRVLNHDEVVAATQKALPGWNIQEFTDYPLPPVRTTCEMFHNASIIIGPHGAGFANLVCARRGAVLVEFQQLNHVTDFEVNSLMLGLHYLGIRTEIDHHANGNVDTAYVQSALAKAKEIVASKTTGVIIGAA